MILNWNFLGKGGAKQKPSVGGIWIFLELHTVTLNEEEGKQGNL